MNIKNILLTTLFLLTITSTHAGSYTLKDITPPTTDRFLHNSNQPKEIFSRAQYNTGRVDIVSDQDKTLRDFCSKYVIDTIYLILDKNSTGILLTSYSDAYNTMPKIIINLREHSTISITPSNLLLIPSIIATK